jgi:uncharacterized membrane protein (DUF106 family)
MIGYIGIGFLTLGKAVIPMLPESFTVFGATLPITLMGAIIVIAVITGIYITFGGQPLLFSQIYYRDSSSCLQVCCFSFLG